MEKEVVKVLSLGAGVQSSALALMYEEGVLPVPPDFAIFADTQAEPKAVYEYLKFLQEKITKFPIYLASRGDLGAEPERMPFFVKKGDGKKGMLWRKCTKDFKVRVVDQEVRRVLGYKRFQKMKHQIKMVIGISTDEAQRMKDPKEKWKSNVYPLINLNMSRKDCLSWYESKGYPKPPKSACVFCPYRDNAGWLDFKKNYPEDFQAAVDYDEMLRDRSKPFAPTITGEVFVHASLKPLKDIDLEGLVKKATPDDLNQQELQFGMNNECEGMCGL